LASYDGTIDDCVTVESRSAENEPDGWDLAPQDIHDPCHKRHPRKEGKGGTP
jgi:hypothetical protein